MRNKIVVGNWKMNLTADEAIALVSKIFDFITKNKEIQQVRTILATPYIHLHPLQVFTGKYLSLAAQNCHHINKGAYTGEISAAMLASYHIPYCIVGHSERRQYFAEDGATIRQKINILLEHGITPIFCCGETMTQRESNNFFSHISTQLNDSIMHLSSFDISKVIIAYEPIWAIGTGLTATPAQAQDIHAYIRAQIAERYDSDIAQATTILYGGSCNAANAGALFDCPDIDGGLIGGAKKR